MHDVMKNEAVKQAGMHCRDVCANAPAEINGKPFELRNEWLRYQIGKMWSPGTPFQTFTLLAYGRDPASALDMFLDRKPEPVALVPEKAKEKKSRNGL
jgi:hypothetical protein